MRFSSKALMGLSAIALLTACASEQATSDTGDKTVKPAAYTYGPSADMIKDHMSFLAGDDGTYYQDITFKRAFREANAGTMSVRSGIKAISSLSNLMAL